MQLSLFVPVLVFFLQIKPVIGVLLVFFLLQVSATLRYIATANNNLSLVIFHGMTYVPIFALNCAYASFIDSRDLSSTRLKHLYKTANLTYMLTMHRATPYLFGVLLGVFLNHTGKDVKISKVMVGGSPSKNQALVIFIRSFVKLFIQLFIKLFAYV